MKKIGILILGLFFSVAAMSQAVIKFEETEHDFGKVDKDGKAIYDFTFTNTGDSALVISGVRTTCGCTSPTWTKTPIEPGKTGTVSVQYRTTNVIGRFNKSVTVNSNSNPDNAVRLNIRGEVVEPAKVAIQEAE